MLPDAGGRARAGKPSLVVAAQDPNDHGGVDEGPVTNDLAVDDVLRDDGPMALSHPVVLCHGPAHRGLNAAGRLRILGGRRVRARGRGWRRCRWL